MAWVDDVDATEADVTQIGGRPYPTPGDWSLRAAEFDGVSWCRPPLRETSEPEAEAYLWHDHDGEHTVNHRFEVWERDRDEDGRRERWVVVENPDNEVAFDEIMRKVYTELKDLLP